MAALAALAEPLISGGQVTLGRFTLASRATTLSLQPLQSSLQLQQGMGLHPVLDKGAVFHQHSIESQTVTGKELCGSTPGAMMDGV